MPEKHAVKSFNITPRVALVVAAAIALLAFAISAKIAMQQPWLGVSLAPAEKGLLVSDVDSEGPSAGILYPGDVILDIANLQGDRMRLQALDITEDPDAIPTFKERNAFRDRQSYIYRILMQPVILLSLADGRIMRVQPQQRPLFSLSVTFWLLTFYSITALLIGVSIWSVKQQSAPARYLMVSGFGAILLLNAAKLFALRELALDEVTYQALTFFYHLGDDLYSFGTIALIWTYPKRLGRFPVLKLLAAYMLFFLLNENFEWTELPGNSVLIQVPLYLFLGALFLVMQWRRSRNNPLDRAIVKVFVITVTVVSFALGGTYLTSVFHIDIPFLQLNTGFHAMFVTYIVLSLSVVRYRIFDIDRWWLEIWLWFFAGVAIIAFDITLVALVDLAPSYAMGISVLIAAWVYFPTRQRLWGKFYPYRRGMEEYVPLLVRHFVQSEPHDFTKMWSRVLAETFRPLSLESAEGDIAEATIVGNGVRMLVPSLSDHGHITLCYAEKGGRLFNSADTKLAQALFNISKASITQRESYANGVLDERKRIMRDLHDDVGGRLLTLTHAEQGSSVAADALKRLREIIYALDTEELATLNALVAKWRIEVLERCKGAGVDFIWQWDEQEDEIEMSPRQVLNLTMILRESLNNIFTHAAVQKVMFDLRVESGELHIRIVNDGVREQAESIGPGKGLRNMESRTHELNGRFGYENRDGNFCVELCLPLSEERGDA